MRISELSEASAVSIPTIKYYIREGLLAPGDRRSKTQADYGPQHLRRLRMIRTLVDIGNVSLDGVAGILAAIDDPSVKTHEMLGIVHTAIAPPPQRGDTDTDDTIGEVATYVDRLGWNIEASTPALRQLAQALVTLRQLGWDVTTDVFEPYMQAADRVAEWELERLPDAVQRTDLVERVVVGTIVFETVLTGWRRLAEQHHSARRNPPSPTADTSQSITTQQSKLEPA